MLTHLRILPLLLIMMFIKQCVDDDDHEDKYAKFSDQLALLVRSLDWLLRSL